MTSLLQIRASSSEDDGESLTDQAKRMCGDNETLCQGGIVIAVIALIAGIGLYFRHRHKKKQAAEAEEERRLAEERKQREMDEIKKTGKEEALKELRDRKTLYEVEKMMLEGGIDPSSLRRKSRED
ncbi:hypothetical protein IAU59_006615 [Kwoniella sp. CBS 9459]